MTTLDHYLRNRVYEWAVTIPLLALSIMVFIWPMMMSTSLFLLIAERMNVWYVMFALFSCSVFCCVALLANGASLQVAPYVRAWAAIGRSVVWFQFALSAVAAGLAQGFPFSVTPFFITWVLVEFYVAYRAVLDVRLAH